jgi:ribosomal protein S15P/S13E
MPDKRVKFYKITNSVTNDLYIGSTTQILYKRLYKHKYDVDKGVRSRLCDLMRSVGKDKFNIEMLEEGVFCDADAVKARETVLIRDRRPSLNEPYTEPQTYQLPQKEDDTRLKLKVQLCNYIKELQVKVQTLEMQVVSLTTDEKVDVCCQTDPETLPLNFIFTDDDTEVVTPPDDIPCYDLTDKRFNILRGKIGDEVNETMKFYFGKVVGIGKHLEKHPQDVENKLELDVFKQLLAQKVARLRLDAGQLGLDQPCLKLLETIENEARIGKNMKKNAARKAKDYRKQVPYEEGEWRENP